VPGCSRPWPTSKCCACYVRIAYLGGPAGQTSADERRAAFDAAIAAAKLSLPAGYVRSSDTRWSEASGEQATADMLRLDEPPTAIVAASDVIAMGALRALRTAGKRVPEDVALVCFDDPRLGDLLDPPITAISQHARELGETAAKVLLDRLAGGAESRPELRVRVELVVRRSCGCEELPRRRPVI
jgi:LacI family transcriptional regulator